jgi:hypothetical protein
VNKACGSYGKDRNSYRILIERSEGMRQLGRPRHRWRNNIQIIKKIQYYGVEKIHLTRNRKNWLDLLKRKYSFGPQTLWADYGLAWEVLISQGLFSMKLVICSNSTLLDKFRVAHKTIRSSTLHEAQNLIHYVGVTGETQDFRAIISILGITVSRLQRTYSDILQSRMIQIRQKAAFLYRLATLWHLVIDNLKQGCTNFTQISGPPLKTRRQKVQKSKFYNDDSHI